MEQLAFDGLPNLSPLVGLKLKLERTTDLEDACCAGFGIVHAGKGPHAAELRCSGCGKHKGWLDKPTVNRLLDVLAHFPEARNDVHIIRGPGRKPISPNRAGKIGITSARKRKEAR